MKKWRFLNEYFSFSKKDRIGLLVLCGLILIIFFLPRWFPSSSGSLIILPDSTLVTDADSLEAEAPLSPTPEGNEKNLPTTSFSKETIFDFDPNTLPEAGWIRLGLKERTAKTIIKYLSKGGHFYRAEDLKKVWGLPPAFYDRVFSHIKIKAIEHREEVRPFYTPVVPSKREKVLIDVNDADTAELIALPGIGSKLANRIVNFRTKLGGFYSIDQLGETYGLPDSTFQRLKPRFVIGEKAVKRLLLNTASREELASHPYVRYQLANAIIAYRNEHGPFQQVEDLKRIHLITEDVFRKLKPYLTLQ